ncbi:MAG: hypothetical protein ACR2QV_06915, partial [Gammaproteobacteria bacterium]
ECAQISAAQERLACFDRAFGTGGETESAAPATAAGPEDAGAAVATAAGTAAVAQPAPKDADFGRQKSKAEVEGESLTSGLAAIGKDAYDRLIFELDNGQLWRQVEYKRFPIEAGQVVEIRHGALGSYKLYVKGKKRWTRVRRVE